MKRHDLVRHLERHGCHLDREGANHSIYRNPANGRCARFHGIAKSEKLRPEQFATNLEFRAPDHFRTQAIAIYGLTHFADSRQPLHLHVGK